MTHSILENIAQFQKTVPLAERHLQLQLPQWRTTIRSNSETLLDGLSDYFGESLISESTASADTTLLAYQTKAFVGAGQDWEDWQREAGKQGRKDAFVDIPPDRLIYKVKTGMLFWQKRDCPLALGPVEQHPNQIINFILTQYLNAHLRQGWQLGHAAGLQIHGHGLAIAGLSGGGKSTLMLHLLENAEHFISNDRLLFADSRLSESARPGELWMRGLPKQPRINPGTIVHNPRLHDLIPAQRRAELLNWPVDQLRQLEEKHDADVNQLYHPNCYQPECPLHALIILNWQANSPQATQLNRTTLNQRPDLLPAIMKSAGPFYADAQGHFLPNGAALDEHPYLQMLGDLPCFEIEGQIDFNAAQEQIFEALAKI